MKTFTQRCSKCGNFTSKVYARKNAGQCKACVTGVPREQSAPSHNARLIDAGYQAYAREEGHYDQGDY